MATIYKLFSPPMVEAILNGTKTMTRRAFKMPKEYTKGNIIFINNPYAILFMDNNGVTRGVDIKYKKGDTILVRESHFLFGNWVTKGTTKTGKVKWAFVPTAKEVRYRDNPPEKFKWSRDVNNPEVPCWYKRNSLFMPKWAVRIKLEITNVRAEFLNNISEEDAIREGVERWTEERLKSKPIRYKVYCDFDNPTDPAWYSSSAFDSFKSLWEYINGKDSFDNKPVQVLEFVRK